MFIPAIMAGGSGTRLWPLSRKEFPKQFLSLTSEESLLQQTLERLEGTSHSSPILLASEKHRFLVAEQLRQSKIAKSKIVLEPFGRNTAPAIAIASFMAASSSPENVLLILPADHNVIDINGFQKAVAKAQLMAENNYLVTFGIVPDQPETGYGYIKCGEKIDENGHRVDAFVEKPDLATAQSYLDDGEHLWNSGMFMFKAGVFLAELEKYQPDVFDHCKRAFNAMKRDQDFHRIPADVFEDCPDISVDYAVMEQTDLAAVVSLDVGWSDIGSWDALSQVLKQDENGNSLRGDAIAQETKNSLVISESRLVSTIGVQDLVVVETKDAVLVSHKDHVQDVRKVVSYLRKQDRNEADCHREVYRPWGHYDSIDSGDRYQVKRICVEPGAKLSVQMHHHRAEHWVVVSGTAKVFCDGEEKILTENQSTYIPVGAIHSLENPGKVPLEVIEVQSGSYLGEDDIQRFEDRYGRVE
ncbi:mannose-1-phosphate guanylyltransferase/mannose-6-phosphate isomerase [Marinomonas sp. 2405UD66-6]|uniref:mannose-1-phosphate guanylyltransferase/mannose-6-phosphate isomerase n=1 Tax=Marinomonas sp. 2405UD66-6 TaxID=3391834 RepID=UPI0039C9AD27